MAGRRRARNFAARKNLAEESISHLSNLLLHPENELANSAARDLIRISKRHGVRVSKENRSLICRTCKSNLRPGYNARIRLVGSNRKITCINCNRVYRFPIIGDV